MRTLFLVFIILLLPATTISSQMVASVVTLNEYPPFCYTTKSNMTIHGEIIPPGEDSSILKGSSWDVVRESLHASGVIIYLTVVPWQRAVHYVNTGQADILFPAGFNAGRAERFSYSAAPVNAAEYAFYVKEGTPVQWEGFRTLKGMHVGVLNEFTYGDEWDKLDKSDYCIHEVPTIESGLQMLEAGRLDAFACYRENCDCVIQKLKLQKEFRVLPTFGSNPEFMIGLKTNPNVASILRAYDMGKQVIRKTGELDKIKNHCQ